MRYKIIFQETVLSPSSPVQSATYILWELVPSSHYWREAPLLLLKKWQIVGYEESIQYKWDALEGDGTKCIREVIKEVDSCVFPEWEEVYDSPEFFTEVDWEGMKGSPFLEGVLGKK